MLGRQRGADLVQLLNFARHSAQALVYLLAHVDQVNVIKSIVDRALQQWQRSIRWQVRVDQGIEPRIVKAIFSSGFELSEGLPVISSKATLAENFKARKPSIIDEVF